MIPFGRTFYKMSGSGNDFVFVDAREEPPGPLTSPDVIGAICHRGTGVGADGIVFVENSERAADGLRVGRRPAPLDPGGRHRGGGRGGARAATAAPFVAQGRRQRELR